MPFSGRASEAGPMRHVPRGGIAADTPDCVPPVLTLPPLHFDIVFPGGCITVSVTGQGRSRREVVREDADGGDSATVRTLTVGGRAARRQFPAERGLNPRKPFTGQDSEPMRHLRLYRDQINPISGLIPVLAQIWRYLETRAQRWL